MLDQRKGEDIIMSAPVKYEKQQRQLIVTNFRVCLINTTQQRLQVLIIHPVRSQI